MTSIYDVIVEEYKNAQPEMEVTNYYLNKLKNDFKCSNNSVLFGTSICPDDINASKSFRKMLLRPFSLGGLGGIPFSGITGMKAFAHHIPDKGDAFIFFGPHIGISSEGQLGTVNRKGQSHLTPCCGALSLVRKKLVSGKKNKKYRKLDYQQCALEQILYKSKNEVCQSSSPIKKLTDLVYQEIFRQILILVSLCIEEFLCERIFLLGGIIINTSPNLQDYVEIRDFEVIEVSSLSTQDIAC